MSLAILGGCKHVIRLRDYNLYTFYIKCNLAVFVMSVFCCILVPGSIIQSVYWNYCGLCLCLESVHRIMKNKTFMEKWYNVFDEEERIAGCEDNCGDIRVPCVHILQVESGRLRWCQVDSSSYLSRWAKGMFFISFLIENYCEILTLMLLCRMFCIMTPWI